MKKHRAMKEITELMRSLCNHSISLPEATQRVVDIFQEEELT